MLRQCKKKIFWPGIRKDLKQKYVECNQCKENKTSKAQALNEVSSEDIFKNFLPGQRLEVDYAENYLMIGGFMQAYKTPQK